MKKITFILALAFGVTAVQAQDFSDPRFAPWGETPEVREQNLLKSNLLKESLEQGDYASASAYYRDLEKSAPTASEAVFIRGAQAYSARVQRARTLLEKKALIDTLMNIYDKRVQYFPASANYGRAYILDRKAGEFLNYGGSDRATVKRLYNEAIAAGKETQYANLPEVATIYFSTQVEDFREKTIDAGELLKEYERLAPIFDMQTPSASENRPKFENLFGTSGVATCENLEKIFAPRLAAAPDDAALRRQAVGLMARANCNSAFFFDQAEKAYAAEPNAQMALMLAQGFQDKGDYNKALTYLRATLEGEKDDKARVDLLVAIAADELASGRASAAAQAASQARAIDGNNGRAVFVLAQAYAASASACGGFAGAAAYWVAYDTMSQAASLLQNDATYGPAARQAMGSYHGGFPSKEDLFFQEIAEGSRYTVGCGAASGVSTTVRSR